MKRFILLIAALGLLIPTGAMSASAVTAESNDAPDVVLVLTPYLRWSDVTTQTPALWAVASEGAVGNLNIRNRNRSATFPGTPEQAALTVSQGAWAALDVSTPSAYSVGETYNEGTAAEAFTRLTGRAPSGADIVFLGLPRVLRQSAASDSLDTIPGTLGGEIVAAGGVTAAVGNGDPGRDTREVWHSRPAGIAAMDYAGLVRHGDVSAATLRDDLDEPFGVATDVERFVSAYTDSLRGVADTSGPSLIVLDPGDLTRATAVEGITSPSESVKQHARAVSTVDSIVGHVLETLPDDAVLLIAAPSEQEAEGLVTGLAPIIAFGPEFSGYLSSSSTQRSGLVTNLDIAATVLGVLEIETPVQVLGNPMFSDDSAAPLEERIASLTRSDSTAVAIDGARPSVVNGFIAVTLGVLLASTIVLLRARRWAHATVMRAAAFFRIALLGILSVPPATLLMFMISPDVQSASAGVVWLAACSAALWALTLIAKRFAPRRVPIAGIALLMSLLVLLDQWLGSPWSFTSFFGYSPLMAARYYGIGNEGAALLFASALVGVSLLMDQWPDTALTGHARRWGVPLLGLIIVATCAAPSLGANVGVVAWGVVGFAVAWALMNGYRVSWKLAVVALVVIVVMVTAFSVVDLGSSDSQTHLGRAWRSADQGGAGALWIIVLRKAQTNMRVLTNSNWSFVVVGVLAFLGFMRWRPQGDFAATLDENPHYSAAIAAGLIGGLAAFFTEDSGIVIPALIMVYLAAGILYLMLDRLRAAHYLDEPAEEIQVSAR